MPIAGKDAEQQEHAFITDGNTEWYSCLGRQLGLSRVEAGNPGFPRLVQGASHGGSERPGKLEVGGASRDSTVLGALEEGFISS